LVICPHHSNLSVASIIITRTKGSSLYQQYAQVHSTSTFSLEYSLNQTRVGSSGTTLVLSQGGG